MEQRPDLARRGLIAGTATAIAAASLGRTAHAQTSGSGTTTARPTLPPYIAWKNPEHMIVHTATTVETKRSAYPGPNLVGRCGQ